GPLPPTRALDELGLLAGPVRGAGQVLTLERHGSSDPVRAAADALPSSPLSRGGAPSGRRRGPVRRPSPVVIARRASAHGAAHVLVVRTLHARARQSLAGLHELVGLLEIVDLRLGLELVVVTLVRVAVAHVDDPVEDRAGQQ